MKEAFSNNLRIPKGIKISGQADSVGSEIKMCPEVSTAGRKQSEEQAMSWCYMFVHNKKVSLYAGRMERDGMKYFVHKTVVYLRSKDSRGIRSIEKPTISGLIFMQGQPRELQQYLNTEFPGSHLVNNCSTRLPAVIPDSVMQPFMRVLEASPERVRFLLHPFKYYAGGNIKLRLTSGFFAGIEGYVIRIDRDRRLVMDVGGMSVAISGVHCETFEVVKDM